MTNLEILIGLPGYQTTDLQRVGGVLRIAARYIGPVICDALVKFPISRSRQCLHTTPFIVPPEARQRPATGA